MSPTPQDHSQSGETSSTILMQIHSRLGALEMGLHTNREAVLDKFRDLKEEVFHRFLRIESRIDRHEQMSAARASNGGHTTPLTFLSQHWKMIIRFAGYTAVAAALITGHMTIDDLKRMIASAALR